jgi:hypothetical protein
MENEKNDMIATQSKTSYSRDRMWNLVGWYNAVGIATCHGLDGPGIESR